MSAIPFPVGTVIDDTGAILTGATVTIASVKDTSGTPIVSHGATVLTVDGSNVLPGSFIIVSYDVETKGEAVITLLIVKGGSTITGLNANPVIFAARDSARILAAIAANGHIPNVDTVGTLTGYVAPDNADIVTSLNDLVALLARTDPSTALSAIQAVTTKLGHMITGSSPNEQFTANALALTLTPFAYAVYVTPNNSTDSALTFGQGDNGISLTETLLKPDGTPIDLTGKTVRFLMGPASGGAAVVSAAATIIYAAGGVVQYVLSSTDLATAGTFIREWKIQDGSGNISTYPTIGPLLVKVIPELS